MNPEILTFLFAYLMILLVGSVALSVFLLYDIKSGNYRRFFSTDEENEGLTE